MTQVTVFIDGTGDSGVWDDVRFVESRHEWLCVSAIVVRTENADRAVEWIKQCRLKANARQAGALHLHKISRDRRVATLGDRANHQVLP